jgi:hypothetical protein
MIDLFSVCTTVEEFDGHRNVAFHWFRLDRKAPPSVYANAILDYDAYDAEVSYPEAAIDELFTREEAELLKAYLDQHHCGCGSTEIKTTNLPIPMNTMGDGAIPIGGGRDHYMLWKEPGYALRFKVEGFFDLRQCERIDGRENIAHLSSQLLVTPDRCVISIRRAAEQLLAKYPTWTSEMALAEVERLAREGL